MDYLTYDFQNLGRYSFFSRERSRTWLQSAARAVMQCLGVSGWVMYVMLVYSLKTSRHVLNFCHRLVDLQLLFYGR